MTFMFYHCSSLKTLDLSNFNTSTVLDIYKMFSDCTALEYLDLSNFDTYKIERMNSLFSGCSSLKSLDLSGFDTSKVTTMDSMFYNCISLTSLDLSYFDINESYIKSNIFFGCSNLEFIKLNNPISNYPKDFFEFLNKTILICVNDHYLNSFEDTKNYINNSNVELVLSSENCTKNYPNTFYPSNTDLNSVIKNSIFLSSYIIEENNESQTTNNINTETQTNFYLMKNETSITEKIKDTFNNTIEINTYFERNTSLNIDTSIIDEKDSVEKVTERQKEEGAYKLIYFNISEINKLLNTFIPSNEKNDSKKMSLSSKLIQNIKNGTLNQLLSQIAKKNQSIVIEDGKDIHLLSGLGSNLNRKEYSSIDFGECEKLLRSEFDINETEPLILYEIEHSVDGFNIPIIEYTLFSQDGKIHLNLSLCDKMKIKYNIPVDINENEINKYDPSSEFYNDECNKYSTEDGIDMTLYDRKNDYNTKNMSLIEKEYIFIGYNTLN